MRIVDDVGSILEARGSKSGREVYASKEVTRRNVKKSFKSKVRTYDSISKALTSGKYGEIFTTKAAGRLYVISKGKWGLKSGRGKIAKGFTPGSATPSAGWESVKKHAVRTTLRYGQGSDKLAEKYGSRSIKKERGLKYK